MPAYPALQVALFCLAHVTSGIGPDGNLILQGDNGHRFPPQADHVRLSVATNGHLIVTGLRGTTIDGRRSKDFGLVTDYGQDSVPTLHPHQNLGRVAVLTHDGEDVIEFDSTLRAFDGNLVVDGGESRDVIRLRGVIDGDVLAKAGSNIHGADDVISIDRVVASGMIAVVGNEGDNDIRISRAASLSNLLVLAAGGVVFDADSYALNVATTDFEAGDYISLSSVQVAGDVTIQATTYSGYPRKGRFRNGAYLSDVVAGEDVEVFGGEIATAVFEDVTAWGSFLSGGFRDAQLRRVYAGEAVVVTLYPYKPEPGQQILGSDSMLDLLDVWTEGDMRVGTFGDSYDTPSGHVALCRVTSGHDMIANGITVDIRESEAGDDLWLTRDRSQFSYGVRAAQLTRVTVGRDLQGVCETLSAHHTSVAGQLHLAAVQATDNFSQAKRIALDSVTVRGESLIELVALRNRLDVRSSVFSSRFAAATGEDNELDADLRSNVFHTRGSSVDAGGGEGTDVLFSRRNDPIRNIEFIGFEVRK